MPLINKDIPNGSDGEDEPENLQVETDNEPLTTDDNQQNNTSYRKLTSACGSDIIIKKRNSRSKPKPIIIYEEDLYGETEPQKIIVKKKTKGRPKKPIPIVEYVNEHGETVDKDDVPEQIIINK